MTWHSRETRFIAATLAFAVNSTLVTLPRLAAQSPGPKEMAVRLTGVWKLNVDLTPVSPKPGRGRGLEGGATGVFAAFLSPVQRGGRGGDRGGGGGRGESSAPLMPAEVAAQTALSVLHEVPIELSIDARAEDVTFRDPRGEWHFKIDDRNSTIEVPGGTLRTRSKWDHSMLRQEFSSAQRALVKTWSIDANDRLVLVERIESVTLRSESKAVFDRQ
jgi:hypothetical protein